VTDGALCADQPVVFAVVPYLGRYLGEFDFRRSTCKMDDTERLGMMVDQAAGLRVSYKRIKRTGI